MSHGVQAGGGGDAQGLAHGANFGHHQGQNFVQAVLGLDHDHGGHAMHGHVHNHAAGVNHLPSQQTGWSSALQAMKLSDALQGINVTPNFLFVCLFAGLTGWLGVIYWIRHHEPLANSVLGTAAAHSATAAQDRALVDRTNLAMPVRTTPDMGQIYVPTPGAPAATAAMPLPTPPAPPAPSPEPQPTPLTLAPAAIAAPAPLAATAVGAGPSSAFHLPEPGAYSAAFGQPDAARKAYLIPEPASDGARVKMIVNR